MRNNGRDILARRFQGQNKVKGIADVANIAYYDQSSVIQVASTLTSWKNLNGNAAMDLVNSPAGSVTYNGSLFGGSGGLEFNGSTKALVEDGSYPISTALGTSTAAWWAIGMRATTAAQNNASIIGPSTATQRWQTAFTNSSPYERIRCIRNNGTTALSTETLRNVGITNIKIIDNFVPSLHQLWVDGAQVGGTDNWTNVMPANVLFAIGRMGSVSSSYCSMEVACVAIGTGALTFAEVKIINDWMISRGVT